MEIIHESRIQYYYTNVLNWNSSRQKKQCKIVSPLINAINYSNLRLRFRVKLVREQGVFIFILYNESGFVDVALLNVSLRK